jgi:hypothetical protein
MKFVPSPFPPLPPLQVTFVTAATPFWAYWDFWVSFFTLGLVLLTGWLAYETRRMRLSSDRISRSILENAQRSLAVSEENARAAMASVAVSTESMHRSLRAYVTLGPGDSRDQDNHQIPRMIGIAVINTGQTPASNVEVFYTLKQVKAPPTSFDIDVDGYSTGMHAVVGNGQVRNVYPTCFLTDSSRQEVIDGTAFLMYYGRIKYRDMLNPDVPRYTEFSYAWDHKLKMFYPFGPMNSVS